MNIHRAAKPVPMLMAVLVLSACGQDADLGSIRTETRNVGSFDSISMKGTARLEIAVGDRESLSIEGREKVISRFGTEVPSPNGELWGRKRFQEVVDAGKQQSLSETLASCFSAARMWQEAEHFPDDAAVVGLELTGGQEGTVNG